MRILSSRLFYLLRLWTAIMGMFFKRVFDIVAATAGIVLCAPFMAATALAILASMGRPVLFRQVRAGFKGRLFTVYKFRTMSSATDERGELVPDAERLTGVGRLIRSASLDELPQLFNVLRGDMSIVGPRPLLPEYLPLYSPEQARRHDVRPGLTCWNAVKGRNANTWEEQFAMDVRYVDNRSFWLDLQIVALTVVQVLRRKGIAQDGHATRARFCGPAPKHAP